MDVNKEDEEDGMKYIVYRGAFHICICLINIRKLYITWSCHFTCNHGTHESHKYSE